MSYLRKKLIIKFQYNLSKVILERPEYVKDLGVYYDKKLSFQYHTEHTASKAYKMLGLIIRTGKFLQNAESLRILYCAYVRSKIE